MTSRADDRTDCPSRDTLVEFHKGLLAVPELEAVAAHLSDCARCEEALGDLDGGPAEAVAQLGRWLDWPSLLDEPGLARMEAEAAAIFDRGDTDDSTSVDPGRRTVSPGTGAGRSVGRYEILEELARGGMGVVYKARQQPLGRLVALKMILAGMHAGPEQLARFRKEGEAAARLEHPNVVRIYDFDEHDGLPYYSMELVEGESLHARLKRGPLPPREAAELVRTAADAVEYAHANGVLHRDLKPGNVLLDAEGRPHVTDFGLAKLMDAEGTVLTVSDGVVGTPAYMAPEQAEGRQKDVGSATDVWALGVILYECLTGVSPFRGETQAHSLELVRRAEPPSPSSKRGGIPRELENVCLRCLEKAPKERYRSAAALADDLGLWLKGERPVGTLAWTRRVNRGLRRAARALGQPTALLGLGLAVALGAALSFSLPDADPPPTDEVLLRRIWRDLDSGRPVTLIGQTGKPAWSRWRTAESTSGADVGEQDGAFTVRSFSLALLELLPDPGVERYRVTAQVRHIRSERMGEVGLYFARQSHRWHPADIQFFTQVTFNDVRGRNEDKRLPNGQPPPPKDNVVEMFPHFHSDASRSRYIDRRMGGATGPSFKFAGPHLGDWHDVQVTVTPAAVTVLWDHQLFTLPAEKIAAEVRRETGEMRTQLADDVFIQQLQPTFNTRGGLGLYVWNGQASFRAVTVTPDREVGKEAKFRK